MRQPPKMSTCTNVPNEELQAVNRFGIMLEAFILCGNCPEGNHPNKLVVEIKRRGV